MPKKNENRRLSQATIVIKGALISVAAVVAICTVTSHLIIKELIPATWIQQLTLSTLLLSSFLGAKYSNISAVENKSTAAIITGFLFVLVLIMIKMMIPGAEYERMIPKTLSAVAGTTVGARNINTKGKGRGNRKHWHNR